MLHHNSKLLLDEHPLIILPSLAVAIGLNESIILQQMHYWLKKSTHVYDQRSWIYNTYEQWQAQLPFWSISTIRRTIGSLEKLGLLLTGNYNPAGFDNTKWYTIDYDQLNWLSRPSVQNEQTSCSNWADDPFNLNRPIPETTSETTTDIKQTNTSYSENALPVQKPKANQRRLKDQKPSGKKENNNPITDEDDLKVLNVYLSALGTKSMYKLTDHTLAWLKTNNTARTALLKLLQPSGWRSYKTKMQRDSMLKILATYIKLYAQFPPEDELSWLELKRSSDAIYEPKRVCEALKLAHDKGQNAFNDHFHTLVSTLYDQKPKGGKSSGNDIATTIFINNKPSDFSTTAGLFD